MPTKRAPKDKPTVSTVPTAGYSAAGTWKAPAGTAETESAREAVKAMVAGKMFVRVANVNPPAPMSAWLKVTSQKSGHFVYLPLPIRLIQQIPDEKGGGCLVRGAQGDEATAKENIVEVLTALNGYPVGGDVSSWSLEK